jgi:hypothetical protein
VFEVDGEDGLAASGNAFTAQIASLEIRPRRRHWHHFLQPKSATRSGKRSATGIRPEFARAISRLRANAGRSHGSMRVPLRRLISHEIDAAASGDRRPGAEVKTSAGLADDLPRLREKPEARFSFA